jgi:hypothetical protein
MTWAKLDDHFFEHPKAIAAGPMACLLYIGGLTYANRFLTDGHFPQPALRVPVPSLLTAAAGAVARARRLATELGPESARAWDLLELAAGVELAAWNLKAELVTLR